MSTRILAIDATTEACSVALLNDQQITSDYKLSIREHAQQILPMIEHILAQSGININNLDAIAVSCGPGSFTGVRIAVSIAQGLAFGADLPLLPLSTLKVLAQGAYRLTGEKRVIAAIDARMGELYWAKYHWLSEGHWELLDNERVISPQQAELELKDLSERAAFAGSGWQSYPQLIINDNLIDSGHILPHAEDILPLALSDWNRGQFCSSLEIEPSYLRNEVTWKKLPGRD